MQRNTTTINNVLKKKITKLNLNQLNIKKIKSANIILKNKKIKQKNYVQKTIAIHSILNEKNYKAKFLTSLIFKKLNQQR